MEDNRPPSTCKCSVTSSSPFDLQRSTVFDDVQGTAIWAAEIDGRAIIGDSFKDHLSGLPVDENIAKYKSALETGDTSRKIIWAYVFLFSTRIVEIKLIAVVARALE
jgi:hypothetical protein